MKTSAIIATFFSVGAFAKPIEKRQEVEWITEWSTTTTVVDLAITVTPSQIPAPTTMERIVLPSSAPVESSAAPVQSAPVQSDPVQPAPTPSAPVKASALAPAVSSANAVLGDITYYSIGLGACGKDDTQRAGDGSSKDKPMIVALSYAKYFAGIPNPNNAPVCNRKIAITLPDGKSNRIAYGIITDACQACNAHDIDVNIDGMRQLYSNPEFTGRGKVNWWFID